MKILYVNFAYDMWGHKCLDEHYIRILSGFSEVYVIARAGWYENLPDNVRILDYTPKLISEKCSNRCLQYLLSVRVMHFSKQMQKREKFDYIIAGTFNTMTLLLGKNWFSKENTYIMHHNNTDLLSRPIYRKVFDLYKKKFNHIVQEDFIKEYLISELNITDGQVVVLPHPLNISYKKCSTKIQYDCIGISNSNDEESVGQLIQMEKEHHAFRDKKIKILLRSATKKYYDEYLEVITGYLSSQKYDEYISSANSILIPFPDTFRYRESGSLIDALSNGIPVLGGRIPLLEVYSEQYPNICMTYTNIHELPILLEKMKMVDVPLKERDFLKFIHDHSDENITEVMKDIFI